MSKKKAPNKKNRNQNEQRKGNQTENSNQAKPVAALPHSKEKVSWKGWPYEPVVLYALSFVIPVVVMLLIFKGRGFYPFGEKSLFIMDMRDQYLEFFASLRNVIHGDDSLFFSWSRSMGGNYLGLFAYYIASPLSFITIFFPLKNMPYAILFLTVLKIGLAGLSFAVFGHYIWNRNVISNFASNKNRKKNRKVKGSTVPVQSGRNWKLLFVLPFAISYALISYNMVYAMCLMWLDGVILLPVILLGVEKILDGRKGLHYMLALAALFICNYYTGYMVGVFTAVYLVYRVLCRIQKDSIREYVMKTLCFTACTILAFGLSAPLILPVVKDLVQGKLAMESYVPDIQTNFEFMKLFGKLKNGVYDSITNSGLPAIYCGYVVIILAVVFFILPRITVREKIGAAVILVFMACSFYFTKWDIAWHGFQYPTWFPYRYAFVASFFLLYMALRSMCGICSLQIVAAYKNHVLIIAAAIVCFLIAFDLQKNGKEMFTGLENEFGYSAVNDYKAFVDKTLPLVEQAKREDKGFYRMNQGYEFSKNDAMLLNYNGMTHYSSTFNASINTLTPKLGLAQAHLWNSGYGSNPLLDSLFSVKYLIDDSMVPPAYKTLNADEEGTVLYENPNVLPIAYAASCGDTNPNLEGLDPFDNQNIFLNTIAGTDENYFTKYEFSTESQDPNWSYSFTADSDNPVYLYMKSDRTSWANVYVNGTWAGNYFSTETSCSLYLGSFQPGEQVVVNVVPSESITVNYAMIGQLHMDVLERTLSHLQENGMDINKHSGGKLSGTIHVDDSQKIITSIPYDAGWTVKIDGKKAEYSKFADTFLVLDVPEGDHDISFRYVSPGFGMGMICFVITILLAAVYFIPLQRFHTMIMGRHGGPQE
ncbi:MAG: YfhO family protein [Lachnospiraceae bacterium]|nr:YfhO family protein [Lachnospiraceae bacterium]